MLVGRAGSLKTWAAQDIALAVATGGKIFGRHDVKQGVVTHLDYEMDEELERRYLQLARGRGISDPKSTLDGKLRVALLPSIYLSQDDAFDALVDAAAGSRLVVIDSLMAACGGIDENDSGSRVYLDRLTHVSAATGACFLVVHHAGKGGDKKDRRDLARGTSAFLDAAGCVLNFEKVGESETVNVSQAKAAGGPFIADQQITLQPHGVGGLKLRGADAPTKSAAAAGRDDADKRQVLDLIERHPQSSQNALQDKTQLKRERLKRLLEELEKDDKIFVTPGKRGAHLFELTDVEKMRRSQK